MNSVERVKEICKERHIPISKLERELGFSNGYIGQLKKGVFPDDRLRKIANYLELSPEYISTGEEPRGKYYLNEETAQVAQEIFENKELRALFDATRDADPEDLRALHNMALALKRK
ncbi:MAG: helix-turn-helix transcriptional regulator, partial [Lachnospiraceae bacterium]|nr:helix-turn-helix transcriptional regulator [Lachnospiraceae bacterium]